MVRQTHRAMPTQLAADRYARQVLTLHGLHHARDESFHLGWSRSHHRLSQLLVHTRLGARPLRPAVQDARIEITLRVCRFGVFVLFGTICPRYDDQRSVRVCHDKRHCVLYSSSRAYWGMCLRFRHSLLHWIHSRKQSCYGLALIWLRDWFRRTFGNSGISADHEYFSKIFVIFVRYRRVTMHVVYAIHEGVDT
jgi:hypothetical protein